MSVRAHESRRRAGTGSRWSVLAAGVALAVAGGGLDAQVEGRPPPDRPEERPRQEVELERTRSQEGGAHEVRRGDTLWELAARYLSDPFRWPEIFRLNTDVVEDPHWIFPGESLRLPEGTARTAEGPAPRPAPEAVPGAPAREPGGAGQEAGVGPEGGVSRFGGESVFDRSPDAGTRLGRLDVPTMARSPLVSPSDHYRAPFLARPEAMGPVAVTARKVEQNPLGLNLPPSVQVHGRVVIALQGISVEPGQLLQAFRWGLSVETHGRAVMPVAVLEVAEVRGDSARAVVRQVFGNYAVGDPVLAPEPFRFEAREVEPVRDAPMLTKVLGFELEQPLLGPGDMLFLDAGAVSGLRLGDELAVFPRAEQDPGRARWEDRLAVVRVVNVRDASATAMVVDLRDPGVEEDAPARLVSRAVGAS